MVVNSSTTPYYGLGDYRPATLKAGVLQTTGTMRMRLLPYAAFLLLCGVRPYYGLGSGTNYGIWELPSLTLGLSYQGIVRWTHVGCKITNIRVSSAEREGVVADISWTALYPQELTGVGVGLTENIGLAAPLMNLQWPVMWHEAEVAFDNGEVNARWSIILDAFQWQVASTVQPHYGHGVDPLNYTARRGPRYLKETVQDVRWNLRSKQFWSFANYGVDYLPTLASVNALYADGVSGGGFGVFLGAAMWSQHSQDPLTPERLATFGGGGIARGVQLTNPDGSQLTW
jgi:hypothetical protein